MKKLFILLISALLLLSACGNNGDTDEDIPDNTKKASNEAVDYYFYYPQHWVQDRSDGMTSIKYNTSPTSTRESYASISVTSFTLANPNQLAQEYWMDYSEQIASVYSDYELLKESETTLGGVVAARKEYKGGLGGEAYNFVQVICVRLGTVYLVTYTAAGNDYSTTISAMETVISNFHFK